MASLAHSLTLNRIQGSLLILRIEIPNRFPHLQRQFHFIVQVCSGRAQNRSPAGNEDRGRGLQEEEGLFRFGVVEFGDVVAWEN